MMRKPEASAGSPGGGVPAGRATCCVPAEYRCSDVAWIRGTEPVFATRQPLAFLQGLGALRASPDPEKPN